MKNQKSFIDKYYIIGGIAAPLIYFPLVIILGALEPGYSHMTKMMSVLGGVPGIRGFLFNSGITTTGLLTAFFAVGLHREFKRSTGSNAGPILILIGSIGLMLSGIFSCNENCVNIIVENTSVGTLHFVSAFIAGMGLSVAPFFIYARFRKNPFWKKFADYTLITAFLANIPGIVFWITLFTTRLPKIEGLIQRLGIVFVFIWTEIIALHIYRSSKQQNKN